MNLSIVVFLFTFGVTKGIKEGTEASECSGFAKGEDDAGDPNELVGHVSNEFLHDVAKFSVDPAHDPDAPPGAESGDPEKQRSGVMEIAEYLLEQTKTAADYAQSYPMLGTGTLMAMSKLVSGIELAAKKTSGLIRVDPETRGPLHIVIDMATETNEEIAEYLKEGSEQKRHDLFESLSNLDITQAKSIIHKKLSQAAVSYEQDMKEYVDAKLDMRPEADWYIDILITVSDMAESTGLGSWAMEIMEPHVPGSRWISWGFGKVVSLVKYHVSDEGKANDHAKEKVEEDIKVAIDEAENSIGEEIGKKMKVEANQVVLPLTAKRKLHGAATRLTAVKAFMGRAHGKHFHLASLKKSESSA